MLEVGACTCCMRRVRYRGVSLAAAQIASCQGGQHAAQMGRLAADLLVSAVFKSDVTAVTRLLGDRVSEQPVMSTVCGQTWTLEWHMQQAHS